MRERYVAAIDQGTASSRCLVFDRSGRIVSVAQKEHHHVYPRPGWVEHDPEEIWLGVQRAAETALGDAGVLLDLHDATIEEETVMAALGEGRDLDDIVRDDPELRRLLDDVQERRLDPLTAVREILEQVFRIGPSDSH